MHPTTAQAALPSQKRHLLINRNYALLWSGQAISTIGDYLFDMTLVLWIATELAAHQPWAPLAVSGVLVAATVPVMLIGPVAGVFVDRWDKRRTMLLMNVVAAAVTGSLVLATGFVPLPFVAGGRLPIAWQLGALYASVFLVNAAGRFFQPAQQALIGDIVPAQQLPRASGLAQVMLSIAVILGPTLAAPLLVLFGAQWSILFEALSFLVSFAAIWAIRAPRAARSIEPGQQGHFVRELEAGIRYYFGNRVLVTLLVSGMLIMAGGGALNALDVFFVTGNLHAPVILYGLVNGLFATGILAGALAAGVLVARVGLARTMWSSLLVLGGGIVVYSRMTSLAPAIVVLIAVGFANSWLNVAIGPLLLRVTPKAYVGRASAVLNPAMMAVSLLSIAAAGYLVSGPLRALHVVALRMTFGPVDTIFTAAGALCIVGALYAMRNLRGVDRRLAREAARAEVPGESADAGQHGPAQDDEMELAEPAGVSAEDAGPQRAAAKGSR
jgi:MFS family permease